MSASARANLAWLRAGDPPDSFPDVARACQEPNGLLAAGGDLSEDRLLYAYRHGIFPWYEAGEPILWWSPDPRCVLRPSKFHVARRLRRWLAGSSVEIRFNTAFSDVVAGCAGKRLGQRGTWITPDMVAAYEALHRSGWAHSIEVWNADSLVGGLYGLAIGRAFFGESMFSRESNASKTAMLALCRQLQARKFELLDCQLVSRHLLTLGAVGMARRDFQSVLEHACKETTPLTDLPDRAIRAKSLIAS